MVADEKVLIYFAAIRADLRLWLQQLFRFPAFALSRTLDNRVIARRLFHHNDYIR